MITAPSGMPVGTPALPAAACSDAPPPLFAGGGALAPAHAASPSPLQAPLAATLVGPSPAAAAGATGAPSTSVAATGASLVAAGGLVPAPAAAAAPAPHPTAARLTTLAPGAHARDAELVEGTLAVLRRSPAGATLVDRLLAVGAKVNVISDAEFSSMGHGDAHAFFDPASDTMYLRRSNLADATKARFAAVALAHEGTHLLDDVAMLSEPFIEQAALRIHAAGGPSSARGAEIQRQAMFELTMIKEARAFLFAGQIARDLSVTTSSTDPTTVAAAGANDEATYARVWEALLRSSYNPERRTAQARNF